MTRRSTTVVLAAFAALCAGSPALGQSAQRSQQPAAPIVSAADSLGTVKALSIEVRNAVDARNQANLERQLEEALAGLGIQVLPPGAYPSLVYTVSTRGAVVGEGISSWRYTIATARLEVVQLLMLNGPPARRAAVPTWSVTGMGWSLDSQHRIWLVEQLTQHLDAFRAAYAGNRAAAATPSAAPAADAAVATPAVKDGVMDYGRVPEGFVPPIPPDVKGRLRMDMAKTSPGALTSVTISWLNPAEIWRWTREGSAANETEKNQQIAYDDVLAIHGEGTQMQPRVLLCTYNTTNRPQRVFWFKEEPFNAAPDRLRKRLPEHPLLAVNPPQPNCPATLENAVEASRR